jgi:cysteine desulfurase
VALAFASGIRPTPLWRGGGQEQGLRPGTENVAAIAGFGAAAEAAQADLCDAATQAAWRDAAAARLQAAGARIIGEAVPRLPNTLCLAVPGWPSERQVMWLDLGGVQVSAGAACSSGKVRPSPVLEAMGEGALAPSALRASGGDATDASQWSAFADLWLDGYARVLARQRTEVA